MKFRQLINSALASIGQSNKGETTPQPENSASDSDLLDWTPDVLGQNPFRLTYPLFSPPGAHSEDYKTALQIAEEYNTLVDFEERMAFWDAHYTVFGLASIIVFDIKMKNTEVTMATLKAG